MLSCFQMVLVYAAFPAFQYFDFLVFKPGVYIACIAYMCIYVKNISIHSKIPPWIGSS